MTTRVAGKRGKLPARPVALGFLHEYTKDPLPAPAYPVDVTEGITDWRMLGNGPDPTCTVRPDGCGCCTFAGREHYRMAKAARAKLDETWETSDQLVEEYLKYDHGRDEGANIADLLYHWYRTGQILAFAPVDHTDPAAVDAALQAFTGVYCGVQLTDDADDLFENGQPWTVADGQRPDPNDGHCIVKIAATGNGGNDTYITWGAEQAATADWSAACVDEAWVIISEEDAHRVDLASLTADIQVLGGMSAA